MGEVIGPIGREDWLTMRLLQSTLKWMKFKDPIRFRPGIEQEQRIYDKIKYSYVA